MSDRCAHVFQNHNQTHDSKRCQAMTRTHTHTHTETKIHRHTNQERTHMRQRLMPNGPNQCLLCICFLRFLRRKFLQLGPNTSQGQPPATDWLAPPQPGLGMSAYVRDRCGLHLSFPKQQNRVIHPTLRGRGVGGPQFHLYSLPHKRENGTTNGFPGVTSLPTSNFEGWGYRVAPMSSPTTKKRHECVCVSEAVSS